MAFTVTLAGPKGTTELPFGNQDKFEFKDGGILAVAVARGNKTFHYAPGYWLELVADNAEFNVVHSVGL